MLKMNPPAFPIRGVIEGFYGVFYTFPERNDLVRFVGEHGYNLYIYAPKNDRQHRARWWEPYPTRLMEQFANTVDLAEAQGVRFCYAISPAPTIAFAKDEDFQKLAVKLIDFFRQGVRSFSLLLDDIDPGFRYEEDRHRYQNYAQAQADLCNRTFDFLTAMDAACTLSMCPTDYYGKPPFSQYLTELGRELRPEIDVFYTGQEVCSPEITAGDAQAYAEALGRKPVIWDNYPVNDLQMQSELHIGPIRGRDPELGGVVKGIVANNMLQAEASKIPLATIGDYFREPGGYNAENSWMAAICEVAGEESTEAFTYFAENSLHSCLGTPEAARLELLVSAALTALQRGAHPADSSAVKELENYLVCLDEACYHLRNRMENLALRNNILPWIELMDQWQDMGRRALGVLRFLEAGQPFDKDLYFMKEFMQAAQKHPKRIMGTILLPLAKFTLEKVEQASIACEGP
jgi:hyaluronoglucosaminidase